VPLGVGEDERRAPRAALQQPPLDSEVLAQELHVPEQVLGRVHAHVGGRIARVGRAPSAAALVEDDDAVAVGVEPTAVAPHQPRPRPAVHDRGRLPVGVATGLPVDVVPVADVQQPLPVRLADRERPGHVAILARGVLSAHGRRADGDGHVLLQRHRGVDQVARGARPRLRRRARRGEIDKTAAIGQGPAPSDGRHVDAQVRAIRE
jgi:hypothetical protein